MLEEGEDEKSSCGIWHEIMMGIGKRWRHTDDYRPARLMVRFRMQGFLNLAWMFAAIGRRATLYILFRARQISKWKQALQHREWRSMESWLGNLSYTPPM